MNPKRYYHLYIALAIIIFSLSINVSLTEAKASGKIRLFTSIPQRIIDSIKDGFVKKYPDIELEIFRAGATGIQS